MPSLFPPPEDFARAFHQEAVRHLADSGHLHRNTEIENHPILKRLWYDLDAYNSNLSVEVRELEALEPNLFGRRNFETAEANTEYPFLVKANGTPEQAAVAIVSPARFFDQAASERYCRTAHDLLTALPALYSDVADWNAALPARV